VILGFFARLSKFGGRNSYCFWKWVIDGFNYFYSYLAQDLSFVTMYIFP